LLDTWMTGGIWN